ncbi:MAG: transposase [Deltaproteobacteria bacterium]|nr:transposase [Deltaproteobacteria bacterium]
MTKKTRRHLPPEKKAEILRRHIADKEQVSDLCNENDLQPSVFYGWLRQLLANAPVALANGKKAKPGGGREAELQARIDKLEARLAKKDAVIAEISEELVAEKKRAGDD